MRPCTCNGNVGAPPELRFTPGGTAVCTFNLATYAGKAEDKKQTTWIRVTCWGQLAETVNKTVGKGDRISASGYLEEPWLYQHKKDGKVLLDEHKLPIWGAMNQMTAWQVAALEYSERPLEEPVPV